MGLDVLSVRCHRHNTSHPEGKFCPGCERERSERHAAEQLELERAAAEKRHGPMCGCPTCERPAAAVPPAQTCQCFRCKAGAPATCRELPPVLQLPPEGHDPLHVREALELARTDKRLQDQRVLRILSELHMRDAAIDGTLARYGIPRTRIAPLMTCTLQVNLPEPAKLIRMDIACDEGEHWLELTRVARVSVGTRTIGEGGSLAQLSGCPLARLVMTPSVGVQLCVENLAGQALTIGGVVIGHRAPRRALRAGPTSYGPSYGDELELYELARFNDR